MIVFLRLEVFSRYSNSRDDDVAGAVGEIEELYCPQCMALGVDGVFMAPPAEAEALKSIVGVIFCGF